MTDTPKLCKDCHWCDSNYAHVEEWTCQLSEAPARTNLVNGVDGYRSEGIPCHALRIRQFDNPDDAGFCNIEGRHWKAKHAGKSCETCGWLDDGASLCGCPAIVEDGDPDCVDYGWANWKPQEATP